MDYSQRVLIVEDQPEVSRVLRSALVSMERNLEVIGIPSGEEAILEARRKHVDLFVVDYRLPGINGLELFHKLQGLLPSSKIIFITGLTDPFIKGEIKGVKPFAFFMKPVPMQDFMDSVALALGDGRDSKKESEEIIPEEENKGLAFLLHDLMNKVKSSAIFLINNQGQILASLGDLQQFEEGSPLMNALVTILASANKLSQVEGQQNYPNYHIFRGKNMDMLFTPLNSFHGILMAGREMMSDGVVVENINQFLKSRELIADQLQRSDESAHLLLAPSPISQGTREKVEPEVEMEPLMDKLKQKVSTDELDAFWNEAVEENTILPLHADDLSYDQAEKLGLTPGDE